MEAWQFIEGAILSREAAIGSKPKTQVPNMVHNQPNRFHFQDKEVLSSMPTGGRERNDRHRFPDNHNQARERK
jgi:hypothetical protein